MVGHGGWYDYVVHCQLSDSTTRTRWCLATGGAPLALRATANGTVAATAQGVGFPFYFDQTLRAVQSLRIGQWEEVRGARYASPRGLRAPGDSEHHAGDVGDGCGSRWSPVRRRAGRAHA